MFKRPVRLFRPVKISTWAGIQAIAEEHGRSVTPGFVRGLLRKEGWRFFPKHVFPPLAINATIGLTLFTAYTTSESQLTPRFDSPAASFLLIPFISGSLAGAAQSLISAPLDNARLLLLRRQRFLRLAKADSHNPRLRRLHTLRLATSAAGTPFVSWWGLLRDAVFQSARTAGLGGAAATTARDRLEQGRRWARRGWSLFGLSLVKDSVGFGIFFVIFEVGREASRIAGLNWDGIDPHKAEDIEEKQRRTPTGLVLQSLGILISGGIAGWIFSIIARPFERMRGAIWEGRSKWAEKDGRLKVIEELALAGTEASVRSERAQEVQRKRRRTSAGGASERRANDQLGPNGRKEFRVRIGRIRSVSRKLHEGQLRQRQVGPPVPPSTAIALRQPMPSAPSLVRAACQRYGSLTFLFASRTTLQIVDTRRKASACSATPRPLPPQRLPVGPTRLSARGRKAVEELRKQASGRGWRAGAKVLSYIPPYAVGFFFYALTSGDLKIEV
ncbi:mitochondrial carrier protein [Rhodotorula toruloides]|uniref:Mitochondrial carrier protein n=1 Tax=Rhodotorula toruloides TaxID=5286 RepID=A0A511KRE7_RHOTO|nr:mitochondrial carrier protein [Rhodotorula toruloides]